MRFFSVSGSMVSDRPVKPTRSAKSTVTTRRSSERAKRLCPHVGQNRAPAGAIAPHDGHVISMHPTVRLRIRRVVLGVFSECSTHAAGGRPIAWWAASHGGNVAAESQE